MTSSIAHTYAGLVMLLVGIGVAYGWPIALMAIGLLVFAAGVAADARQGGRR
jgi:hypothetical protein